MHSQRLRAEARQKEAIRQRELARLAESQAKELAEKNRLDTLNTQAIADSLYWKGLINTKFFNLEEQIAMIEKAKEWRNHLTKLDEDIAIRNDS